MLRSRSNWMTIVAAPSELVDVICAMPAIWPNCCSSGAATEVAMVSALAPLQVVVIWMVGKSTCGSGATGRNGKRHDADERQRRHQQRRRDRPPDEGFGNAHDASPCVAAVGGAVMVTGDVGLQLVLAVGDDAIAVIEARRDDGAIAGRRAGLDRPRLDGVVRLSPPRRTARAARAARRAAESPRRPCGCRAAAGR